MDVAALLRLNIRRRGPGYVYVDCPVCGDKRGKTNLNLDKNVWHCNYCQEGGGMLSLYAKTYHISNSEAYHEICETLMTDGIAPSYAAELKEVVKSAPQVERICVRELHRTYSAMLSMLTLTSAHREHLRTVRGLTNEQIDRFGFKSTPTPFLCRGIADRLIKQGCTVQGVPGFYLDDKGCWTVKFYSKTAGILIPIRGMDGMIQGLQVRLDHPIKSKDDPPDKGGVKYLCFSSSDKNMGASSGCPVHFVGDPTARVVYVTEGALKADIAHALTGRTFLATIGANNTAGLDVLFAVLKKNGTEEIIEAEDMDKYRNKAVSSGASKIYLMARKHGLDCRRLTWNPKYKGIDDWQLAIRRQEPKKEENTAMNFKQQYLHGHCKIEQIDSFIEKWRNAHEEGVSLREYLGLTDEEYAVFLRNDPADAFEKLLDSQRHLQRFRLYQIDLETDSTVPYAFLSAEKLHKLGYEQPRASDYRLVYDRGIYCPNEQPESAKLERLFQIFNLNHPGDYRGRSLSISDVVELYDGQERKYYYCDTVGFAPIGFSPMLAKPPKAE
ncbi:MAG: DNA primase [Oscillospiraceae bacterium]|nr:DNA primase [Oscillospiraceae bacterium]